MNILISSLDWDKYVLLTGSVAPVYVWDFTQKKQQWERLWKKEMIIERD